jgi:membrane-associated phospholipid phosphatase
MSFVQALSLTLFITEALKVTVARPRPNFFSYCGYDSELKRCTGKFSHQRDSKLSFPSGHASMSFTAATWLSLFISTVWPRNGELWWVFVRLIPIFVAIFIAATRITDYMHHVSDVVAGTIIGIGVGTIFFLFQTNRILMTNKKKIEEEEFDPFSQLDDQL